MNFTRQPGTCFTRSSVLMRGHITAIEACGSLLNLQLVGKSFNQWHPCKAGVICLISPSKMECLNFLQHTEESVETLCSFIDIF